MNISEILRYSPRVGDIIMHKDGSYHIIKSELRKGSMTVNAMHHINGSDPVEVQLNVPKTRSDMIQGTHFLVRKNNEDR